MLTKLGDRIEDLLKVIAKAPVRIALVIILAWTVIGGGLYSLIEPDASWIDGMYWVTVVMPTVGFGDFSPVTVPGRVLYVVTVVLGFWATLILGGAVGAAILQYKYVEGHHHTAELEDDFCAIKDNLLSVVDECDRLIQLTNHPAVKQALETAHKERNGTS